jgi:3-hydroxyacyl-CoA dehydrogenase/enoyl-CoA hydratase/3-hydroxybutyryl-CoA epimerase
LRQAHKNIGSKAKHYPALDAILEAVSAGLHAVGDEGFAAERHAFGDLAVSPTSRHLVQLFFQREKARTAATWVTLTEKPAPIRKVGVIGGGVMGAGITHWCASQGFIVAIKEISPELVEQGLTRIQELFDEAVRKRALTADQATSKMGAIHGSADWSRFGDVDLVIEAATEKMELKQSIFRELAAHVPNTAVLATNTSALSVTTLAETTADPARVLGLHFFNPVHKMQLVEIVTTPQSDSAAVTRLVEFVKKLGKTPIVCADSPGFVVNRILFPYLDEAVRLACDGVPVERIDRVIEDFGMPMGPLELLDQVGLDVAAHVAGSLKRLSPEPSPTPDRLAEMVQSGRLGRKSGAGFYRYVKGKKTSAVDAPPPNAQAPTIGDEVIRDRMVLRLVNEAAKVVAEGVVAEPWIVDLAMVFGAGFAPHSGGPLAYAEQRGTSSVLHDLELWQRQAGPRFAPSNWWANHTVGAEKS